MQMRNRCGLRARESVVVVAADNNTVPGIGHTAQCTLIMIISGKISHHPQSECVML